MGYIKVAPLCMYDSTIWVLGIIRGCHTSNNLYTAEKLKLPMVAPSRVRSSPHTLSAAPLPTEFISKFFWDYCSAARIEVKHNVTHVHTKNGLAKSLIK